MIIETIQKVWKAGKTGWVVTCPQNVRDTLNIEEGDLVKVTFEVVKKARVNKNNSNELKTNTSENTSDDTFSDLENDLKL